MSKNGKKNANGGGLADWLVQLAEDAEDGADWRTFVDALKDRGRTTIERCEDLVRAGQAMRNAGVLDASESHYLISSIIEQIAEDRVWETSPALKAISAKMREVEIKHGLTDGQYWPKGEGPPEYENLNAEYDRVIDEILAATFEEHGEIALATMHRHHRQQFDQLREEGRSKFFGRRRRQ